MYKENELGRYQAKMIGKNPGNCHVWMMEESRQNKRSLLNSTEEIVYHFVDDEGTLLYNAVYEKGRQENFITLYGSDGYELGGIAEKISARGNAYAVKSSERSVELEMYFRNEPMGLITNNIWKGSWFLSWDIVNWGAERKRPGVCQIV